MGKPILEGSSNFVLSCGMVAMAGVVKGDEALPSGGEWLDGHYYLVITDGMNWSEARSHAESLSRGNYSAHLVTLETEAENEFVANLARAKGIPRASWIGCSDEAVEGEWRWITGELVSDGYEGWNPDEPNDGDGGEDFGEIGWHAPSTWNDSDGLATQGFTVEFEPGANGLPAGGEWLAGHYYLVITDGMNWSEARSHAESLSRGNYSAHLVTLETEAENEFVANLARSKGIPRASWIGCSDEAVEREWRWLTGELVSDAYEGWNPGEPSDGDGGEDFGEIGWHAPSTWNDSDGLGIQGFTVEFEPGEGIVPREFRISEIRISGEDVAVSFPSRAGKSYLLQSSSDLMNWSDASPEMGGTGEVLTIGIEDVLGAPNYFYRVKEQSP